MKLSDSKIKKLKPESKQYSVADGNGLALQIKPTGGKLWRFRYRWEGKQQMLSLGKYPDVSLSQAREWLLKARKQLAEGVNPSTERKGEKRATEIVKYDFSVESVLTEYLDKQDISDAHYKRQINALKNDVFPELGGMHIKDVTPDDIKMVVTRVADRGAIESSRKMFYSLQKLFKTIKQNSSERDPKKYYEVKSNPCSDIDITDLVGRPQETNYPTITDPKGINSLLQSIKEYTGYHLTRDALLLLSYTALRPANVRLMKWSYIDLKEAMITIPAPIMKTKQDLLVPLSTQAVKLLEEVAKYTGKDDIVFPSPRSKDTPLSDGTLLGAIRRIGYTTEEFVPHSFRSMFSTIAHEKSEFKYEAIEMQLAHSVGSKVSQAYNRAKYLDERAALMQWWGDYLESIKV